MRRVYTYLLKLKNISQNKTVLFMFMSFQTHTTGSVETLLNHFNGTWDEILQLARTELNAFKVEYNAPDAEATFWYELQD